MTSNIMKSQLSRLYGQLYAFQVRRLVLWMPQRYALVSV